MKALIPRVTWQKLEMFEFSDTKLQFYKTLCNNLTSQFSLFFLSVLECNVMSKLHPAGGVIVINALLSDTLQKFEVDWINCGLEHLFRQTNHKLS